MPGGNTFNKTTFFDQGKTPFALSSGKGAKVWDVDGNEYTDYIIGLGSVVLGYCFDETDQAIIEQLARGITFPLSNPLEQEVAKKLIDMIPCAEMVRYGKNGSDVLTAAVRLSRHISGKDHVVFGGYHGWHDWCIARTSKTGGIPKTVQDYSHKFIFNDIDSLEQLIKELDGNVACVVMDIVARYYPEPGFLEDVRALTKKHNIILVFDEIITGFRIHKGGAQAYFNVIPDLACFGKAMGNGMPISAIVGKAEYMSRFEEIFYALNFASESLSLAATSAVLDFYNENDVTKKLADNGSYVKDGLQEILERNNLDHIFAIQGMLPRPIIGFKNNVDSDFLKKKEGSINDLVELIIEKFSEKNILCNLSVFMSFSHTREQLSYFLNSFDEICDVINKKILK